MSIVDSTGVARNFVLISRSGLDAAYACTNPPAGYDIRVVDKQTRPSKVGATNSVLRQVTSTRRDATTGEVYPTTVNLTFRSRNDDSAAPVGLLSGLALTFRGFDATDATTMVGEASDTNIQNLNRGALPTP